ncbi:hypothetical protein PHYPSEUDO_009446 [Phytophthora pseudosyringae]|uniref:RxLR effector protein n=1 Tax=Phytophthora pseudosyringae TaxID=221518 RepID=A0A8T1VCM9_9STRA|nr:hypothetical protein PHYPSEUDO_009446 [Phytophthora pseudosyringae]
MNLPVFILALFVAAMVESTCAIGLGATDLLSTESASSASATGSSASAASSTSETEAPTTIMVLLPDNLAASYSGSGSVMFFAGSVGDDDNNERKSAGSDTVGDEASSAASKGGDGGGHDFLRVCYHTGLKLVLREFTEVFHLRSKTPHDKPLQAG